MGAKILFSGENSKQKGEKTLFKIKVVIKKGHNWDFFAIFARDYFR